MENTETTSLHKELTERVLNIDSIFLDPNNPRFVSLNWLHVIDERIDDVAIQKETLLKMENMFSIDRLVMNIEVNGFLPIDRIIVRQFKEDKYVVLEGNRRLSAAKVLIQRYNNDPNSVAEEIIESLTNIPCLIYLGSNTEASWIFQGLRHIMGIQEWSSFNKAKLIVTLMQEEDLNLTQVGKRFGLTAFGAGQWVRGYKAFLQAKEESEYIKEIDERAYPFFQELFSRSNSPIRDWLGWDEGKRRFANDLNFSEFLSWLYPKDEEENLEGIEISDTTGDWNNRKISKRDDLRSISYLISKSPTDFELFRSDGDLERSYSIAIQRQYEEDTKKNANPVEEVYDVINSCIKVLDNIPFKMLKNDQDKTKLYLLLTQIEDLIKGLKE